MDGLSAVSRGLLGVSLLAGRVAQAPCGACRTVRGAEAIEAGDHVEVELQVCG